MTLEQIFFLALIQGLTEFLPVSSSGHLVLVPTLLGWKDQGLFMDVAVHLGTLGSVLLYFWRDVGRLFQGLWHFIRRNPSEEQRFFLNLVIATLPVIVGGFAINHFLGSALRSVYVIAGASILFGLLLYVADQRGYTGQSISTTTPRQALIYGLAQMVALINGVSRSGICMTAGRFMGYNRSEAARFSFLMSIPAIGAAGTLKVYELIKGGDYSLIADAAWGALFAFASGLVAISFMMKWVQNWTLTPFVVYRVILGIGLLVFFSF